MLGLVLSSSLVYNYSQRPRRVPSDHTIHILIVERLRACNRGDDVAPALIKHSCASLPFEALSKQLPQVDVSEFESEQLPVVPPAIVLIPQMMMSPDGIETAPDVQVNPAAAWVQEVELMKVAPVTTVAVKTVVFGRIVVFGNTTVCAVNKATERSATKARAIRFIRMVLPCNKRRDRL